MRECCKERRPQRKAQHHNYICRQCTKYVWLWMDLCVQWSNRIEIQHFAEVELDSKRVFREASQIFHTKWKCVFFPSSSIFGRVTLLRFTVNRCHLLYLNYTSNSSNNTNTGLPQCKSQMTTDSPIFLAHSKHGLEIHIFILLLSRKRKRASKKHFERCVSAFGEVESRSSNHQTIIQYIMSSWLGASNWISLLPYRILCVEPLCMES